MHTLLRRQYSKSQWSSVLQASSARSVLRNVWNSAVCRPAGMLGSHSLASGTLAANSRTRFRSIASWRSPARRRLLSARRKVAGGEHRKDALRRQMRGGPCAKPLACAPVVVVDTERLWSSRAELGSTPQRSASGTLRTGQKKLRQLPGLP